MKGQASTVAIVAIFAVLIIVIILLQNPVTLNNFLGNLGLPPIDGNGNYYTADLRGIFADYMTLVPGADAACIAAGGSWEWDNDIVGCVGAGGGTNCATAVAAHFNNLCTATGAVWHCNGGAYCAYS